ncbi:unnamed protein product [Paramecium pentaurelia]|uniref:Uncharacterized protein n=1 Tax=Paramecium pentaurelia TaxID=43138 RepID=A0A8S1TLZ1_9CILI|nr:unnamed protein product [Paramecium pentaurelia]
MIELGDKKYIKASQRKKQIQVVESEDLYKTILQDQDDSIFSTNYKRGPEKSIEEEYLSRQMNAPFIKYLPTFQEIQHQNQTNSEFQNQEDFKFRSNKSNEFKLDNQQVEQQNENYFFNSENEQEYKIIKVDQLEPFITFSLNNNNGSMKNEINNQQKKNLTQINKGLIRKTIYKI